MLQLYGHDFSSFTWKAKIALYANVTPFDFKAVRSGDADIDAFVQSAHPQGKFPILRDDDRTIIETSAIIEYLHRHHRGPAPLLPDDPDEAIRTRMLDRVFDHAVMGSAQHVVDAFIRNHDNPDAYWVDMGKADLARAYDWLEAYLGENAMPPHVSLATCAAAPSLFYADWIEPIGDARPRLAALRGELLALAPVARCVEEARPFRSYFPPGAPDQD